MGYVGLPSRYADMTNPRWSEADILQYQDRLQNIYSNGGPGLMPETLNLGPIHIDTGIGGWVNDKAADLGRWLLGWGPGTNPGTVGMALGGGTAPGGAGFNTAMGASSSGAATPGGTGSTLAQGAGYGGWSVGVNPMAGGFGLQSTEVLNIAAPKINEMERQLQDLRAILAQGGDLTQSQMLKYQDLMQRMNQIFMWCQGVMQSEHEKNKNWAQTLGRI